MRSVRGADENIHNGYDGVMDMYQWYYGSGRYPEKHDRKNAISEMVMTIGGGVLVMGAWFVACILWLKGVI